MKTLVEKKEAFFSIADAYVPFLERRNSAERKSKVLARRKAIAGARYQMVLVGFVKRGKSTLLNALLGNEANYALSPAGVDPCTAAIVKYIDAALYPGNPGKEGAIIRFNDGSSDAYIEKSEVVQYIDQRNSGFGEDAAKRIDCVEMYGKFPLIETRGIIIDTPGKGALYDQDYLSNMILPEVDVIICPVDASHPLSIDEVQFLFGLPESEKAKLVFVLTKTDDVERDELGEVVSAVKSVTAKITGGNPPLYQVAAKKVLDAWKAGKTGAEIEAVKKACGMKGFEDALDKKLRAKSSAKETLATACGFLEAAFKADKEALGEEKQNLTKSSAELEQQQKELEEFCRITARNFKKHSKELKNKWNREAARFIDRLSNKEAEITNALSSEADRKTLWDLIGYSKKLSRKIQARLQSTLGAEVSELDKKLAKLVEAFPKEFEAENDAEIVLHCKTMADSSLSGEIKTLFGGGIAVSGGLFDTGVALPAISSILTAAAKVVQAIGNILGKAATGTLVGGVVPILGGLAVTVLACHLGTNFARNQVANNIPKMVGEQLKAASDSIKELADKMLDAVLNQFNADMNELLDRKKDELAKVKESLSTMNKPQKIAEIERDLGELDGLSKKLIALSNEL
jgi:GTP-binding protein EngB required for normal cell division